jgi:hypothetical protein
MPSERSAARSVLPSNDSFSGGAEQREVAVRWKLKFDAVPTTIGLPALRQNL